MAAGPLDRWLQRSRAPLEPVQAPQDSVSIEQQRSQQTAEPAPSAQQQQEQQKAPSGTLDGFLKRLDDKELQITSAQAAEEWQRCRQRQRCLVGWVSPLLGHVLFTDRCCYCSVVH